MASVVTVPRLPTTVALARDIARRFEVPVTAEITADGIEIRFGLRRTPFLRESIASSVRS